MQPHDSESLLLIAILATGFVLQSLDTIDLFFQSQVQSKFTVLAKNLAFLISAGVKIILIHIGASLWSFAASSLGETALGAIGLAIAYRATGRRILEWRSNVGRARQLMAQSWPLILSGLAVMIYMRLDMVMLKMMKGDSAVGLYAAVTRVSEVWYFIPTVIVSSAGPAIIRAKHNAAVYHQRLQKLFSLMALTALVIGSGIALESGWIIRTLYSGAYSSASATLAVHIWASIFVFLGVAQSPWDVSENLLKLSLYRAAAGAVINVALNLVLIPRFSALGAAIATVVAYAISAVFANVLSSRTRPIFYMQMKSLLFTTSIEAKP
jgi:PST family polysaccharide transporter